MFSLGHRCVCICLLLTFSYSPVIRILSLQCAEINPHSVLPFSMLSIKWEPGYYWAALRCISLEAARLHQQTSSCDFDRDSTCLVHWPGSRATVGSTGIANHSVFKSSQHKPAPFSAKHPLLPGEALHSWGKKRRFDTNTLILSTGGGYRWPQIHSEQSGCVVKSSYVTVYQETEPFGAQLYLCCSQASSVLTRQGRK